MSHQALEAVLADLAPNVARAIFGILGIASTGVFAAVAFAKAKRRRQIMIATSSVGPGSSNMITAAATAHANRLPVLFFSGDTFQHRLVDPVLQQVENFGDPSTTVSDSFRAVTRYWDRITQPVQILHTLPQALATMLDPEDCGPAYLGLPQDICEELCATPKGLILVTGSTGSGGPIKVSTGRSRTDGSSRTAAMAW